MLLAVSEEVFVRAWFPLLPVVPLPHKNSLSSTSSSLLFQVVVDFLGLCYIL